VAFEVLDMDMEMDRYDYTLVFRDCRIPGRGERRLASACSLYSLPSLHSEVLLARFSHSSQATRILAMEKQ